jgi:hypothetical protein
MRRKEMNRLYRFNSTAFRIITTALSIQTVCLHSKQISFSIGTLLVERLCNEQSVVPDCYKKQAVQTFIDILEKSDYTITLAELLPLLDELQELPDSSLSKKSRTFLHDLAFVTRSPQFFSSLSANNIIVCNDGCFGGNVVIDGNLIVNGTANISGLQGPTGAQGTTGAQGATGSQGPIGAQGSTGAQGAIGPQGPTGSCFQNNFAHVYDTTTQNAPLAFTNITISTNEILQGWTHTPGSAILTCPQDGTYLIIYTAQARENVVGANGSLGFRMTINGSPIVASTLASQTEFINPGSGLDSGPEPITRSFIQMLSAGDELIFQFRADTGGNVDGINIGNADSTPPYIVTGASFAVTISQINS